MTGPEHYRQAEELLTAIAATTSIPSEPAQAVMVQIAQVHATLALASATAHTPYREYETDAFGGSS